MATSPDSPKQMRAVVMTGPGQAEMRRIDRWTPRAGEALVRCTAAAVCTTERAIFQGRRQIYPSIGGHEVTGVVEALHESVSGLAPGDPVAIDGVRRCGRCHYCRRGADHLCLAMKESRRHNGFAVIGGGFADFTFAPAERLFRLSPGIDLVSACLIEPLACCIHSLNRLDLGQGEVLVVLGAGTMGVLHCLLADLAGARILVSDIDPDRLDFVRSLGDFSPINPGIEDLGQRVQEMTDGRGADAVAVTTDSLEAGQQALEVAAPLGRVVYYSSRHPSAPLKLDWNRLHYQEIVVTGASGKRESDFRSAVELVESGRIDLSPLVSKVIELEDLPQELAARPAGDVQRVVVKL